MKVGYSMLLGEYLDATGINYTDCKSFQVVCPACKEPIFKVERKQPPPTLHYLSHYERDKAYVEECELRVSRMTSKEMDEVSSASRNQKLEYFLSVLREAILESNFTGNKTGTMKMIIKVSNACGIQIFRDVTLETARQNTSDPVTLEYMFKEHLKFIKKHNVEYTPTSFSIQKQIRIATDIWIHLLSSPAKGNFTFLFTSAYLIVCDSFVEAAKKRTLLDFEKVVFKGFDGLIGAGRDRAARIFSELGHYPLGPPHAMEGSNLLNRYGAEIADAMLGILIRIPYFELLKKANGQGKDGQVKPVEAKH